MSEQDSEGCKKLAKWAPCTPAPLPEGTLKDKVAFLLSQGYQRRIKDIVKIIYPGTNEHSLDWKSQYSYIRSLVAKLTGQRVHFHRGGRFRLVWRGRPVRVDLFVGFKQSDLLGLGLQPPDWMNMKGFFDALDVPVSRTGRKHVGSSDSPCTFEISRTGYVTVYVHDLSLPWESWLVSELVRCRWPEGLALHVLDNLQPADSDPHVTVDGFSWPRHLKGVKIRTPYGMDLTLGDGSHPASLEMQFRTNVQSALRSINEQLLDYGRKIDDIHKVTGWIDRRKSESAET